MADYKMYAFFTAEGEGKAGLTVTVTVYDSAGNVKVASGSATGLAGGMYRYTYTDTTADDYIGIFKTTDTTVDAKHIPAMVSKQQPMVDDINTVVDTIVSRLTADRAGYLDKLNIGAGTIANTGNASSFKADVSALATATNLAAVKTETAAIKAKTDNLPASPAATGDAMTLADGAIKAATLASNTITADKIASNAIAAAKIASGAITDAKIATDAISAAKIKADAVTKIQNGLATPTNITSGTITTVTNLTNLPAIPANWLTADGIKADAVTKVQNGLAKPGDAMTLTGAYDAAKSAASQSSVNAIPTVAPDNAGITAIKNKTDNLPLVPAAKGDIPTVSDIATAVWSAVTRTLTALPTMAADWITALGIKSDAVTKIQSGLAKTTELPTDYATETNATANKNAIELAITNKPVTPATDLTGIAKTSDLTGLAEKTDLSGLALEATLTAMKGAGWSDETLVAILAAIDAIDTSGGGGGGGLTAQDVWEYATRTLTTTGAPDDMAKESTLTAIDALIKAIKAKTDLLSFDAGRVEAVADATGSLASLIGGSAGLDAAGIRAALGLAMANLDAQLAGLGDAIDDKPVTPPTDISSLPTKSELGDVKDDIIGAIDDKPVTPVTDISELVTKDDLEMLAKDTDMSALMSLLTTIADNTGTAIPQLLAGLPAGVWSYITRTLTVSSVKPRTLPDGDQFSIYKDTSVLIPLTDLGDISAYTNLWFTMKREMDLQAGDEKAIIHADKVTGLLYIDQAAADDELGGITINDPTAGNISVWLHKSAAALLPVFSKEPLRWEVKGISPAGVDILLQGTNYILPAVTRKIT